MKVIPYQILLTVCNTVQPPTSADICDINSFFGEVNQLYFTRWGDSLTAWTSNAEWVGRLHNSTVLPALGTLAKIRSLFGIGGIGAPERGQIVASRRRIISTTPKYSMVFNVEDTSDTNMTFASLLPVAGQVYAAWFGTEERLFGGNTGVYMTMIADPIIPESIDEIMKIQISLSWTGAFPEVIDNHLS